MAVESSNKNLTIKAKLSPDKRIALNKIINFLKHTLDFIIVSRKQYLEEKVKKFHLSRKS